MRNNVIQYQVNVGDSLYQIAGAFKTTVENILRANPHIDPTNLKVGEIISIPMINNSGNNILREQMRNIWEQHVFWTRLVIISILEGLADEEQSTNRLLRNAKDIANIYRPYYGDTVAKTIENLITDHLVIASKLVHAIKNNDPNVSELNKEWYKNADDIALALSKVNPQYDEKTLKDMLYKHLDLTAKEISEHLAKRYSNEIETFDMIEEEALMMSDYLSGKLSRGYIRAL